MSVTALVSGGKDSLYSAYLSETQGWPVDELLTLQPSEADSLLFHTPNLSMVELQAIAWGKRHRNEPVEGVGEAAEVRALERALSTAGELVVAGAIASSYQWSRLHRVCHQLGRRLFTPLWGKAAHRVVLEEISAGLDIRLVHLAAEPLTPEMVGRRLDESLLAEIERRSRTVRAVNSAGEGGEYETLVVSAPFWTDRIVLDRFEVLEGHSVTSLVVREAHLEPRTTLVRPRAGPPD